MAANVILVEPDEDQQKEFLAAVKGSPFQVTKVCATNEEAVAHYDKAHTHVVVLRLLSGKEGAAQALDELRKKNPHVKAVASYNVGSTHLLMAAYSHGAISAIKQPFRLHRVVEKLTFAVASERHDKLRGAIIRLEHPVQVRYKNASLLALSHVGFCERLGTTDIDLNTEKPLKVKAKLKVDIMLPPPAGTLKFTGIVEDAEQTKVDNWCSYLSLANTTSGTRKAIEAFLVKAARKT
jgi:DNA-binding response OmpR family regulator